MRNTASTREMVPADLREALLSPLAGRRYKASITALQAGILAGAGKLISAARELRLDMEWMSQEGCRLASGACVCRFTASALQAARAEEHLLGVIGKTSGVATAAARFVAMARGKARIVCGAWKKVAPEVRQDLRGAIQVGGAGVRLVDGPFLYLDKNHVRIFGGVEAAVRAAIPFAGRMIVVQLKGESRPIAEEAEGAARAGVDILMVDTGNLRDLAAIKGAVASGRIPRGVTIAFGGGVHEGNLPNVVAAGADIVDVGRAIIDAPLLDFRMDVMP